MIAETANSWGFASTVAVQGVILVSILLAYLSQRRSRLEQRITQSDVAETKETVRAIETAVNHVPEGSKPLIERVSKTEADVSGLRTDFNSLQENFHTHTTWERQALAAIAQQVGIRIDH